MKHWLILVLLLLTGCLVLVLACGDDDDDSDTDDDTDDDDSHTDDDDDQVGDDDDDNDDNADDDDSSDDDDASDDDDSGDDDDDNDDDPWDGEDRWGMVYVSEGLASSNFVPLTYYNAVGASFSDPDDFADWNQPVEQSGDCERFFYDNPIQFDYHYVKGGNITITGANVGPIHLAPVPYTYGYYYEADYDPLSVSNLFDAGDTVSFSTTGSGSIPAFSGQLTAPAMIQVTKPSNFDSLTSVPSGAMTFSWNAKNALWVTVMVSTYKNQKGQMIYCTVPDQDGSVTIPASLMADLYSSPDMLMVMISRIDAMRDTVDEKDLDFQMSTYRQRGYYVIK